MGPVKIEVRDDGLIQIEATHRDKENIDMIPGSRWKQAERSFVVPMSWAAMQQCRGVFGDRLVVGDKLNELAWQVYEHRVKPCLDLRFAEDCDWIDGRAGVGSDALEPLQRAAAGFMVTAGQAFEADPMGSGKTPITICALRHMVLEQKRDVFPIFIVANNGAKVHWRDEFATWWPDVDVSVITGNVRARREAIERDAQVYVYNWEGLKSHSRLAGYGNIRLSDREKEPKELNEKLFKGFIADEIHRGKDPRAKQTRAAFAIADSTFEAGGVIFGLTGSLIANTPEDLWAPGHIVCAPEYPSKTAFVKRYALMSWNPFGSLKAVGLRGDTKDELYSFLDPRLIRRPKEKILPQLEGKLRPVNRTVDLLPKQRRAYNSLRREMLAELEGGTLMVGNPLTRMQRLRQLSGATGALVPNERTGKDDVVLKEPSSKLDELVQVLEELGGDSAVVYAESRQLIELAAERLTKAGITAVQYTGKVDENVAEENRKRFQAGEVQVILCTYGKGAESINLSRADALIRLEFSWSAIKNSQAEERPQRPGRQGPLRVINIISADTIDLDVIKAYGDKLEMLEEVVRDEETLRRWLS